MHCIPIYRVSSNSLNRLLRIVPWVKKNIFYSILKMNL